MNSKQRRLLQIGIGVAVIMGVFPPWTDSFQYESLHSQGAAGYAFILAPPKAEILHSVTIDIARLMIQWVVVALAVGCGILYLREPTK